MTWTALVLVIVQILGPLAVEWLRSLLERAAALLDAQPIPAAGTRSPEDAVRALFSEARKQVPFWRVFRRAALGRLEVVMLKRANEIVDCALQSGPVPCLTTAEEAEIGMAVS